MLRWIGVLFILFSLTVSVSAFDTTALPVITAENASQIRELAMLGGGHITVSKWSPDARVLAVGTSLDVRLYHVGEGEPIVLPETGYTDDLSFNLDSTLLASAHRGRVYIWDIATGERIATWGLANRGSVIALDFIDADRLAIGNLQAESGNRLATGVWLWNYRDSQDGIVLPALGYHSGVALAINAANSQFATTRDYFQNGTGYNISYLEIHDATTGDVEFQIIEVRPPICQLIFSPTDNHILVSVDSNGVVRLWDTTIGEEKFALTAPEDLITSAAFTSDGNQLVTGGTDNTVRVWSVSSGALLHVYPGQPADVRQLTSTPDGDMIAFGILDETARAWNVRTLRAINNFTLQGYTPEFVNMSFTSDGQGITTLGLDGTIRFWDIATLEETAVWQGAHFSEESTAFSPDGRRIAHFDEASGELYLWDAETRPAPTIFQGEPVSWVNGLVFNTDGSQLAVATFGNGHFSIDHAGVLHLWEFLGELDLSDNRILLSERGIPVRALAFSPTNQLLAYVFEEHIYLRDLQNGDITTLPRQYDQRFDSYSPTMTFSPDGRSLALHWALSSIELWDIETRTLLRRFSASAYDMEEFSPDGRLLLFNSTSDAHLYDVASGTELAIMRGHTARVIRSAFNQDGTLIATTGLDGTIRLWGVG